MRDMEFKMRISVEEYKRMEELSKEDTRSKTHGGKKNMSAYVRKCALASTEKMKEEELQAELKNIRYQITKIGVNINQTVKKINAGFGNQLDIEILEEELRKLNAWLEKAEAK